jgi:hypothetical protein
MELACWFCRFLLGHLGIYHVTDLKMQFSGWYGLRNRDVYRNVSGGSRSVTPVLLLTHSDIYHVILNDSSHTEPTVAVIGSDEIAE